MKKLKKVGLLCGIGIIISFFLDYKGGILLMELAGMKSILWLFPVCGVVAAFFAFKDNFAITRIAFFIALGLWVYWNFLSEYEQMNLDMNFFGEAGIGGYLLVASSAVGAIFSK